MTKKQIKKALALCQDGRVSVCRDCPYTKNCDGTQLFKDALDLITKQEKDIKQLKTECALLDDELRIARQDTIDALNKVKERAIGLAAIETYHICNLVDELLKEYE